MGDRFYLASGLENAAAAKDLRDRLVKDDFEQTYDWMAHGPVWRRGSTGIRRVAQAELAGVAAADFVVVLLPGGRGTHVELGYALGLMKPIYIIGVQPSVFDAHPDTCAFYHLPGVRRCLGVEAFWTALRGDRRDPAVAEEAPPEF